MENWKETKCGKCKIQRSNPICNSCMGYNKFIPITQADRIRSMSDEELAEIIGILAEGNDDCAKCPAVSYKFLCKTCKEGILEWLQSEVE